MATGASVDARDDAFESLMPLAELSASAVNRLEALMADERKLLGLTRDHINVGQRAALDGLARFAHGVQVCGEEWEKHSSLQRVSTPPQEAGSVYLWLLADRFLVRLKHEPVTPLVDPGALRLIPQLPSPDALVQVYFTWDISLDGKIARPSFVCLDEPAWTIPLSELLEHARPSVTPAPTTRRGPSVRSARPAEEQRERDES